MFLKGDSSNQISAPHSYGTSLPMVESELKYNEFRKKQEKQRNWDYNVQLKVVRLKLLWVVPSAIGCGAISCWMWCQALKSLEVVLLIFMITSCCLLSQCVLCYTLHSYWMRCQVKKL